MAQKRIARISPVSGPLMGDVSLPGSKSATNRALLVASLARGHSRLGGILRSDDTHYMMTALEQMGVVITQIDETTVEIAGTGRLQAPAAPLFLGNAGTAVRFLTAAVALVDGPVTVTGDAHMQKRPIGPLIETLRAMGVEARAETGCPPVEINGKGGFVPGAIEVSGALSSQYISAIMMLAAMGDAPSTLHILGGEIGAAGYLHITATIMRAFGADLAFSDDNRRITIQPTGYAARAYTVEPDASAATYLWAAEALTHGRINIGAQAQDMHQPDAQAHEIIGRFPQMPAQIDGAQMQDAIPTLAVLAAFNEAPVRFTGIANLRVKECDRIRALHKGLTAIRPDLATVEGDDLVVHADPSLDGQELPALIDSHADHRIAMSFALAGLKINGIAIDDAMCVSKTFPTYWQVLKSLGVQITGV